MGTLSRAVMMLALIIAILVAIRPYVTTPSPPVLKFLECGYDAGLYGGCITDVHRSDYRFLYVQHHHAYAYTEMGELIGELPFGVLATPYWIAPET